MGKLFYYGMIILMIVSGLSFFYELMTNTASSGTLIYLCFLTLIAGAMALMTQPKASNKQKNVGFKIVVGIAIVITAMMFTSCKTGYGCHSNESWKHMERRINRP